LPKLSHDYEVIIIDDGSTDRTSLIADELERDSPFVSVVHHAKNAGYGCALRSGFARASKELIFYTDGDGQYDTGDLPILLERMTDDVDVVNGFKLKRADSAPRRVLGGAYNQFAHLLFRLPVRDVDCDFRLIRRERMQQIELTSTSGAICVELIAKLQRAGCRFTEVGVHHFPRTHGRSQFFTVWRIIATMIELVGLRLRLMSHLPAVERVHS
jgi:glycosyltransferase involved in cell wall biosynthesis